MHPLPIGKLEIDHKEFWLSPDARRKHFAIFGKSGVGKTTLMRVIAGFERAESGSVGARGHLVGTRRLWAMWRVAGAG